MGQGWARLCTPVSPKPGGEINCNQHPTALLACRFCVLFGQRALGALIVPDLEALDGSVDRDGAHLS